jgi:DNA-binding HxlR family transcriptional regulator
VPRSTAPQPPVPLRSGAGAGAHPLALALKEVGDRWSLQVVEALLEGPKRFADLEEALPGIATNILTQRLRRLEAGRLVVAVPYRDRPVRYAYHLSDEGRSLAGAVRMLTLWSAGRHAGPAGAPAHPSCGTALELRWWCPTCEQPSGQASGDADEVTWV